MLNQQLIDEVSAKVRDILGNTPARDIETNMRAMLAAMFARLDLVTRHEFDVQTECRVFAVQNGGPRGHSQQIKTNRGVGRVVEPGE